MKTAALLKQEFLRLQYLLNCGILDTPSETAYDELVSLTITICDMPIGFVGFLDLKRQWFKARKGIEASEMPRNGWFGDPVLSETGALSASDTEADPRFKDTPLVLDGHVIRSFIAAPIQSRDGYVLGTLCALDRESRPVEPKHVRTLQVLARQIAAHLELRYADEVTQNQKKLQTQKRLSNKSI